MNQQEPQFSGYNYITPPKQPKKLTFAILSLVFSILPLLLCCCTIYPAVSVFLLLLSVLALVFGIISLATHRDGKGLAVTGIIISVLTIILLLFELIFLSVPLNDMTKFSQDPQGYIDNYEETGEVPEEFAKYNDNKYDWVWTSMGMNSFTEFYGKFIEEYKTRYESALPPSIDSSSEESDSDDDNTEATTRPANYGEELITI